MVPRKKFSLAVRGLPTIALLWGCGSVAGSDPSFWTPSHDPGGKESGGVSQPAGGASGSSTGAGGTTTGAGGSTTGAGGSGNAGFGGSFGGSSGFGGSFGGSTTGVGGSTTGAGGSTTGVGGSTTGVGGSTTGVGGSTTGAGGSTTGAGGSGPVGACSVTFTWTTVTAHGSYAPNNVDASWVMDPQNKFVKTLEEEGFIRQGNLSNWVSQTGSNIAPDTVTGATLPNHITHTKSHWDCTGAPAGTYTMWVEMTESDSIIFFPASKVYSFQFPIGNGPGTINPPDQANFTGMSLVVQ